MTIPQRIQASRQHKEPQGTRRVSRPSRYANDYKIVTGIGRDFGYMMIATEMCVCVVNKKTGYISLPMKDREAANGHAVIMFKAQMRENLKRDPAYYDDLLNYKHISCFCDLSLSCHCDPIIQHLKEREKVLNEYPVQTL